MSRTEKIIFGILIAAILLLIFMIVRAVKNKKEDHVYDKFERTKLAYPAPLTSTHTSTHTSTSPHTSTYATYTMPVSPTTYAKYTTHATHATPATPVTSVTSTVNRNIQRANNGYTRHTVQDRLHRVIANIQRQIYENNDNGTHIIIHNMHADAGMHPNDGMHAQNHDESDTENDSDNDANTNVNTVHRSRNPSEFFDEIQRNNHDNDSQNVHNTQINVSLAKKYDRLYELHIQQNKDLYDALPNLELNFDDIQEMKISSTMREIRQFAEAHISDKYPDINNVEQTRCANMEREKITSVLNEIQKGNTITSISNAVDENGSRIPISEDWILTLAWEHIHSHDNIPVQKNLQEALYDQLIDATYTFSSGSIANDILRLFFGNNFINDGNTTRLVIQPVCINGRVGRILSSFTLIDTDPILAEPEKDDKEIANEAYTKANRILEEELNKFIINIPDSPETRIRDLYSKDDSDLTDNERTIVTDFSNHVRKVVAETLHKEYEHLIDEKLLVNIVNNSVSVM